MTTNFNVLTTSPEHPFAHGMLTRVLPSVVQGVIDSGTLESSRLAATIGLRDSLEQGGVVPPPTSRTGMTPSAVWSDAEHCIGKPWIGLPSYLAESLFYALFLETIGYFDTSSAYYATDPFLTRKLQDLSKAVTALGHHLHVDQPLRTLLLASLWGNLADAAHLQFHESEAPISAAGGLLIDESQEATNKLQLATSIGILADNAGSELVADLALAGALLASNPGVHVTIYLKQRPYFIADATMTDALATLATFRNGIDDGDAIAQHVTTRRLQLLSHWFFHSPLHYDRTPPDLLEQFATHDVLVCKGDLHYRRLLGDRLTSPTLPLASLLPPLGVDLVIARTLKSDICAGLTDAIVRQLDATARNWRFAGRFGVLHVVPAQR